MITKRMVGMGLGLLGLALAGGVLVVDIVGVGKWHGLGPAQFLALRVAVFVFLIGLSLIPLGDRPA